MYTLLTTMHACSHTLIV